MEIITNQKIVTNKCIFANVGPNLSKQIPETNKLFTDYLQHQIPGSMYLTPITPTEVQNKINELNTTKATDIYDMPGKIIKIGSGFLSPVLANIFNQSLTTGIFPNKLKSAYVIPVHKTDSRLDLNKYRSISILPTISKIFEKLMAS